MVGNGFGSRFDGSGWFWVVLGPDLIVGCGFVFIFNGSGPFWVALGPDLLVGVVDFNGWKWFLVQI